LVVPGILVGGLLGALVGVAADSLPGALAGALIGAGAGALLGAGLELYRPRPVVLLAPALTPYYGYYYFY